MSEIHHRYLNNLLLELSGLETSLQQIAGMVEQAGDAHNKAQHDQYQHELTQLSLKRQDLIVKIEKTKQQTAQFSEHQHSDLEAAWLSIKDSVRSMLGRLRSR